MPAQTDAEGRTLVVKLPTGRMDERLRTEHLDDQLERMWLACQWTPADQVTCWVEVEDAAS